MTFEELGILVILDSEGYKWDGTDEKQRPQSPGQPGSRARALTLGLGRNLAPILGARFIHVRGHPRPLRQLL